MASLTSDQKKPKTIIEEKELERVKPLIPKKKEKKKKKKKKKIKKKRKKKKKKKKGGF